MRFLLAGALLLLPVFSLAAQSHVLVVTGIGGEPRFSEHFLELGKTFAESAVGKHGVSANSVVFLAEDPARAPGVVASRSTAENVEKELQRIAATAKPGDHVVVLLIGHGSSQGAEGRFNLPGADLGATDFARLLEPLGAQRVAFLNLSSGSGDFVGVVSSPNRVVITATRTGFERNESFFARYFVQSFSEDGADTDKDGRVSLYEAYDYALKETKRFYDDDVRLQTEHAMLDDNGDGKGTHELDLTAEGADGLLARTFYLGGRVAAGVAASNPRLAQLLADKADIEATLEKLRQGKSLMDPAVYEQQLEKLLVDLALKAQEIRAAGGGGN